MLQKLLAVLLVVCSVVLSGFDPLDDLDRANHIKVLDLPYLSLPNTDQSVDISDNSIESADQKQPSYAWFFDPAAAGSSVRHVLHFTKPSRLHKLHRLFLI